MMNKKNNHKLGWAKWLIKIYWGAVGLVGLVYVSQASGLLAAVLAATGDNASSTTTSLTFGQYVCTAIDLGSTVLVTLAVLMVIAAGIIYATSMGASGGELSVGLSKQMIVAALTGLLLYMIGGWLIGVQCKGGDMEYGNGFLTNQLDLPGGN
ncbi:MAG: hypothetical protein WC553_01170 [Patescibacteria group bacterium]|jgi:hypothetical protein